MKYQINKIAFLCLLMSLLVFSRAYAIPDNGDNCSAQTMSSYCISVESPIQIDVDNNYVDAGDLCPGCLIHYEYCDCPNIIYTVKGGPDCHFAYQAIKPVKYDDIDISFIIYYSANGNSWTRAKTNDKFSFNENGEAQLKACVYEIAADCTAATGTREYPLTIYVQYTCGSY